MIRLLMATVMLTVFAFAGSSAPAQADEMDAWTKAVAAKLAKNHRYPRSARAKGIEGRAEVRLTVASDGQIVNHEVETPTGETSLDRSIPKLIKRMNPLPALPDGRDELSFTIPVVWRLQ